MRVDSWKPEGIEARLCGDLILYMFLSDLKTEIMLSALVFEHCKTATVSYTRTVVSFMQGLFQSSELFSKSSRLLGQTMGLLLLCTFF